MVVPGMAGETGATPSWAVSKAAELVLSEARPLVAALVLSFTRCFPPALSFDVTLRSRGGDAREGLLG